MEYSILSSENYEEIPKHCLSKNRGWPAIYFTGLEKDILMKGTEAFEEIIPLLTDEPVIHANGYICRESFNIKDREENFYMIGSMGLASSIGLGVAINRPDPKNDHY